MVAVNGWSQVPCRDVQSRNVDISLVSDVFVEGRSVTLIKPKEILFVLQKCRYFMRFTRVLE